MKLNYKRTLLVGLAFLSISTFWQAYDGIIPLILKNTFGIGEGATGQIMAIDNMLALIMLPLFGALSDKTHTPLGKSPRICSLPWSYSSCNGNLPFSGCFPYA